jgi:hypothetical protein
MGDNNKWVNRREIRGLKDTWVSRSIRQRMLIIEHNKIDKMTITIVKNRVASGKGIRFEIVVF